MSRKYNKFVIGRRYAREYYKFLYEKTDVRKVSDAYSLLDHSIKKVLALESVEYSATIHKYSEACIAYLSKVEGTSYFRDKLSLCDKIDLVNLVNSYAVMADALSSEALRQGRV